MRRDKDNLLNTADVFKTLGAGAYGQLIEYLWRLQSSRRMRSSNDGFEVVVHLLYMYIIITKTDNFTSL